MDVHRWGSAPQIWRRWVLLSAAHEALGLKGSRLDADESGDTFVERRGDDGTWVRMRRFGRDRAVLWGSAADHTPPVDRERLSDETPDWAVDSTTADRWAEDDVCFVAWHTRRGWTCFDGCSARSFNGLLAAVLTDDGLTTWWEEAAPQLSVEGLTGAVSAPNRHALSQVLDPQAVDAARAVVERGGRACVLPRQASVYLRSELYAQMRATPEIADRGHPKRPVLLRQWARVHSEALPFRWAVCAADADLVPAEDNAGLRPDGRSSICNVLRELYADERDEQSGGWLFARVTSDGRQVVIERAYDGWPAWYPTGTRPSLAALAEEMEGRARKWRPAWAGLLPQ